MCAVPPGQVGSNARVQANVQVTFEWAQSVDRRPRALCLLPLSEAAPSPTSLIPFVRAPSRSDEQPPTVRATGTATARGRRPAFVVPGAGLPGSLPGAGGTLPTHGARRARWDSSSPRRYICYSRYIWHSSSPRRRRRARRAPRSSIRCGYLGRRPAGGTCSRGGAGRRRGGGMG